MSVYDRIGDGYDLTRRADPYLATRIAHQIMPHAGCRYLDVACGTGNYTVALERQGGKWWGVDASATMIEQAKGKSATITWACAAAEQLPFPDGFFDGALCCLALHHFGSLVDAWHGIRRVMGRGALVIFTSTPEQMRGYWLNAYFPETMRRSMAQMPAADLVERTLVASGFVVTRERYFVQPDLADGFLYSGKLRPHVYLSEQMRAGSSTFRTLADPREVQEGVRRLRDDLETGRFAQIATQFESPLGDYLFLVARLPRT